MDILTSIKQFGVEQAIRHVQKDPKNNLVKLMDWADRFSGGEFVRQRRIYVRR